MLKHSTEFDDNNLKFDYLINNADVARGMAGYTTTCDEFEGTFGINHLGHLYLTNLSAPSFVNQQDINQVTHDRDYDNYTNMIDTGIKELKFYPESSISEFAGTHRYALAESCTILMLFSRKIVKKYGNDKIVAVSLQRGVIRDTD